MDLILSEPQKLLQESAVRLCRDFGGARRMRAIRDQDQAWDTEAWQVFASSGWHGIAVPETHGGSGMGLAGLSLVLHEMGRNLSLAPLAESQAALVALAKVETRAAQECVQGRVGGKRLLLPAVHFPDWTGQSESGLAAEGSGGTVTLSGTVAGVPYAMAADDYLVHAVHPDQGDLLCLVAADAGGLAVRSEACMDGSSVGELKFEAVSLPRDAVVATGTVASAATAVVQQALALSAGSYLVGLAQSTLDVTLEYMRQRKQFGKALGSFQALQHSAADCFVEMELNHALLWQVLLNWDAACHHPAMVCAVKARATRVALDVTRAGLQMHGAMGYTDECDIGLYYKRAMMLASLYGNEIGHTRDFSLLTQDREELGAMPA